MTPRICPEEQCTGCASCFNICPQECIHMVPDVEGFLRPEIDSSTCNACGECMRVCPMLHLSEPNNFATPQVYACWNKDEAVRFDSASGGAFSAFAQYILARGGVVFGAAFDKDMRLRHVAVSRREDLGKLRSSKYVQSDVGHSYSEVREFLHQKKLVLFSGTPCQVAALKAFIGEENTNLFTCDMLCHGVPSPDLLAKYIDDLEKNYKAKLVNINFRHKRKGWELATTMAFFDDGRKRIMTGYDNSFMYGFINCFTLRPVCYQCPYTSIDRCGDITLADFWGIGEVAPFRQSTRNGISLILVNSEKGSMLFDESAQQLNVEERTLQEAMHNRTKLSHPLRMPNIREQFFADYQRLEYVELVKTHLVDKGLKGMIKRIVPQTWIFYLLKYIRNIRR